MSQLNLFISVTKKLYFDWKNALKEEIVVNQLFLCTVSLSQILMRVNMDVDLN